MDQLLGSEFTRTCQLSSSNTRLVNCEIVGTSTNNALKFQLSCMCSNFDGCSVNGLEKGNLLNVAGCDGTKIFNCSDPETSLNNSIHSITEKNIDPSGIRPTVDMVVDESSQSPNNPAQNQTKI